MPDNICSFCGVAIQRSSEGFSSYSQHGVNEHSRICGRIGTFVCPYCRKHSSPSRASLNLKNLGLPKRCPFCERRISLTKDSGRFELEATESINVEMVEPEP